ncbi:aspartate/glutamate racemase family protein [Shewanella sp. WXL01]|uniref:Aspartate/glutamate racemase family protein n=1 Tax=Shewanella maritima TaxID=2520507 RepID=A0A411PLM5_9GAMM|nr:MULTISPECIES: aspartate/glutamate racemase family protein [Shewanella]NKF52383.1 aspartate/glutamate racemase family protein [Shewanella sp. WXL01]QBF84425.1 aspartate/glutamate racemase family protein [Shewanella maritima]
MKTIGLIGGMSWQSTMSYYQLINTEVGERLGGLHSAKILLNSVDFAPIAQMQSQGEWLQATQSLAEAAQALQLAGADAIVICTNTMHKVAAGVAKAVTVPLLHIVDPTAQALHSQGINKVGLLGTGFTMREAFYKQRLEDRFAIDVVTPDDKDMQLVHDIIYQELCHGVIKTESKQIYLDVIRKLEEQGAQGVILGCTEIGLLVQQADCQLPLFDTTSLHASAAVNFILS